MAEIFLNWTPRCIPTGYRIYQSEFAISESSLPTPLITLGPEAVSHVANSNGGFNFMLEAFLTSPSESVFTGNLQIAEIDIPAGGPINPPIDIAEAQMYVITTPDNALGVSEAVMYVITTP